MQRSCLANGWELDIHYGDWHGDAVSQVGTFARQLPKYRESGYRFALRLDNFDIIALGSPGELPAAMEYHGNPVLLMAAELAAWPGDYRLSEYPPRVHPWWFAHSPLVVDLSQELPAEYLTIRDESYGSDQKHFADLILDRRAGVAIDRDCLVVQSLGHCQPWAKFFAVEGKRVRNRITRSLPLFAHGNGRTDMSWVPLQND